MTEQETVKRRWPSAHVLPGDADTHPSLTMYAVFIGTSNLKGGNGKRRKSGWHSTEGGAWTDAARRVAKK